MLDEKTKEQLHANYPIHTRKDTFGVKELIEKKITTMSLRNLYATGDEMKFNAHWSYNIRFSAKIVWAFYKDSEEGSEDNMIKHYYEPVIVLTAFCDHWKREYTFCYLCREYPELARRIADCSYLTGSYVPIDAHDFLNNHRHENNFILGIKDVCGCERCLAGGKFRWNGEKYVKKYVKIDVDEDEKTNFRIETRSYMRCGSHNNGYTEEDGFTTENCEEILVSEEKMCDTCRNPSGTCYLKKYKIIPQKVGAYIEYSDESDGFITRFFWTGKNWAKIDEDVWE